MQRGWWMLMTVLLMAILADVGCRCAWSRWTGQPFQGPRPAVCLPDDMAPLPESAVPTAPPSAFEPAPSARTPVEAGLAAVPTPPTVSEITSAPGVPAANRP
ncbi:MAG: hypothetical protein ACK5F7_07260, partial [Planctomycetaceae bacterium]